MEETIILDENSIKKEKKKTFNRILLAVTFGILPFVMLFFPYIEYQISNLVYKVSCIDIIFSKGINFNQVVIGFPITMKVILIINILSGLFGLLLIILKKPLIAGLCYVIGTLATLTVLLFGSVFFKEVAGLGIDKITTKYLWPFIITIICNILASIFSVFIKGVEKLAQAIFLVFACVSVGSVAIITLYMIIFGTPAIAEIGILNFVFGMDWDPTKGEYGIFPIILSSIFATLGAILIGVPIGILTAVFLSEIAPPKVSKLISPAVQLLAGIPSVVYGFFGMLIIVPIIKAAFPNSTVGDSLLAVIIILAIMVLPTIVSVTQTSLRAVPNYYREAALALGTTPVKTIFKVAIPVAKSGIISGVILGVGRAIGETMAVIMVAGNVVNMPSILGTVRLLTTGIVLEMSYSSGLHRQALFGIGLILFVFIMIVNISFSAISKKGVKIDGK